VAQPRLHCRWSRLPVSVIPRHAEACGLVDPRIELKSPASLWRRPHKAHRPGHGGCTKAERGTTDKPGLGPPSLRFPPVPDSEGIKTPSAEGGAGASGGGFWLGVGVPRAPQDSSGRGMLASRARSGCPRRAPGRMRQNGMSRRRRSRIRAAR
jgi:hypothetical protein